MAGPPFHLPLGSLPAVSEVLGVVLSILVGDRA
jgi:hypothetical protein